MRNILLLAGAALAVGLTPATAQAKGPKAHVNARGHIDVNRNGVADWREQRMIDANGNGILDYRERARVDINRNGIPDYRERWIDRDRDGIDDRQEAMGNRYGGAACPPGLAKKSPACVPPGQANRSFREGQRVPSNYRYYTPYGEIPVNYRTQYNLDDDYRYIYRDQYIYEVDPLTSLVRRIIGL
jgi:hypothetical protein